MRCRNDRGMALTVVMIIVIMLALLAGYMTQMGYNQRRLADTAGGRRAKVYYRAQAGLVEAAWRIRENHTAGLTPASALGFNDDTYNPNPYQIDIDGDGSMDATVDISQVTAGSTTRQRQIQSTGLDT